MQKNKIIMEKERFSLTSGANLMWTVSDAESGVSVEFREGLFNETQTVRVPNNMQGSDAMQMARIMREIGEWMSVNHSEVALCDWQDRRSAIWKLSHENYWLAMAAATNSLLFMDMDAEQASFMLYAEVCDWLDMEKTVDMTEAEEENLKGVLSELTDGEAWEVFRILHVFWNDRTDCGIHDYDMHQWALDITWWSAWLPEELKRADESEEDNIIGEE